MTESIKNDLRFERFYIRSCITGNCGEKYLEKLVAQVTKGRGSDLKYLRNSLPRLGLLTLLQTQPGVQDECTYFSCYDYFFNLWLIGLRNSSYSLHMQSVNELFSTFSHQTSQTMF